MDDLRLIKLKGFANIEVQFDPKKDDKTLLVKGYALKITPLENNPSGVFFTLPGTLPFDRIFSNEDNSFYFLDDLPVVFNDEWFNKFPGGWGTDMRVNLPAEMHSPGVPIQPKPQPGES